MKSLTHALKTLTVSLTLVCTTNSVSFAAEVSSTKTKELNKTQLMQLLRESGLPEGTQQGVSTTGDACELIISTETGKEKLSMKSAADQDSQRLLLTEADYVFYSDIEDVLFDVTETKNGMKIVQDFEDSSQTVILENKRAGSTEVTLIEYIAGDERKLTCNFKQCLKAYSEIKKARC